MKVKSEVSAIMFLNCLGTQCAKKQREYEIDFLQMCDTMRFNKIQYNEEWIEIWELHIPSP